MSKRNFPFVKLPKIGRLKDFERPDHIILRDHLALERTRLANERTLMAYIRTSLYLILGGIAFLQLKSLGEIRWLGFIALTLSAFFIVFGCVRYFILRKKLKKYYADNPLPDENEGEK